MEHEESVKHLRLYTLQLLDRNCLPEMVPVMELRHHKFCSPRFQTLPKACPFAAALSHIHKQQKSRSLKAAALLVPVVGLEPTRCRHQRILSPSRLPFHHTGKRLLYYILSFLKFQESILSLTKTFFFQRFPAFFLFFIANLFTILLRHYSTKKDLNFDQIVVKLFIVR